jgi:hypothetical protein
VIGWINWSGLATLLAGAAGAVVGHVDRLLSAAKIRPSLRE